MARWGGKEKRARRRIDKRTVRGCEMTYSDFTLELVERAFGFVVQPGDLFPALAPLPVPAWLQDLLARGRELALVSEKARSEFIVAPLLLACREMSHNAVAIYSGQRLDVLPE